MKSFLIFLVVLVFLCSGIGIVHGQGQKEEIQLSTYYPAPYGTYNNLEANRLKVGIGTQFGVISFVGRSTDPDASSSPANSDIPDGSIYYNTANPGYFKYKNSNGWQVLGAGNASMTDNSASGYVRIGNMQICWGRGSFFGSGATRRYVDIIFQQPFAADPAVSITSDWPEDVWRVGVSRNTLTRAGFTAMTQSDQASSGNWGFSWMAIGRWQ